MAIDGGAGSGRGWRQIGRGPAAPSVWGQRALTRRGLATDSIGAGHRPGPRLGRLVDWWQGRSRRRVGDSGGGPATPSRPVPPQAWACAGRTRRTTVTLEGGGPEGGGAGRFKIEERDDCWGTGERSRASGTKILHSLGGTYIRRLPNFGHQLRLYSSILVPRNISQLYSSIPRNIKAPRNVPRFLVVKSLLINRK
jgi:hypothetical protein